MAEFKRLRVVRGHYAPLEDGTPFPPEGQEVEVTLYYRRRLNDGDLVVVEDDPEPAAAESPLDDDLAESRPDGETEEKSGKTRKGAK